MAEFKKGDVVQLKSGGPKMTIANFTDSQGGRRIAGATCVWFDNGKKSRGVFGVEGLVLVSDKNEPEPYLS